MHDSSVSAHPQSTDSATESISSALQRTDALDIEPISEDLSYYPLAFISCALPYQDPRKRPDLLAPTEAFSWSRHDGVLSMSLDAGSYIDSDGTKQFHLPYGLYPRVLLMWLTTSALKRQSRTFPLPSSARGLLSELNVQWGPGRARDVITQLRALLATQCVVTYREQRGDNFVDISEERFTIGTKARLRFSTDADSQDFDPHQPSQVWVTTHCVASSARSWVMTSRARSAFHAMCRSSKKARAEVGRGKLRDWYLSAEVVSHMSRTRA